MFVQGKDLFDLVGQSIASRFERLSYIVLLSALVHRHLPLNNCSTNDSYVAKSSCKHSMCPRCLSSEIITLMLCTVISIAEAISS